MVSDLPEPCVCQMTPARWSPSGWLASTVVSTALFTAQYWWYAAAFLAIVFPSSSKVMKCRM